MDKENTWRLKLKQTREAILAVSEIIRKTKLFALENVLGG